MVKDALLYIYIALDLFFAGGGAVILAVALTTDNAMKARQDMSNVAVDLLLASTPLEAGVINAIFIFATFLASLPGIISPTNRLMLKAHGAMVMVSGVFTMLVGLLIWFKTLKSRANLNTLWAVQPAATQSLLQQTFKCCGYNNATSPPFIQDSTCTNPLVAANLEGCVSPFSKFANQYLDIIFTGVFGIVAIDALLVLTIACVLKDRKEKERYRLIDEKHGIAPI